MGLLPGRAALLLLLLPALAAAKPKIVLDAAKPMGPLLEKALKSKYAISKASLADSPTGGDVKNACREAGGAIAVVTARAGGGELVTIMVLNGADGSPLATFRVKAGRKPPKALAKPDLRKLLDGLDDAKPPKKEEAAKPPPEEKKPPPDEEKKPPPDEEKKAPPDEEKPKKRGEKKEPTEPPPPPKEEIREKTEEPEPQAAAPSGEQPMRLRFGAGLKLFNRQFGYTDDVFDALSTYRLPLGPAIAFDLEAYPLAFLMNGFAGNIGLMGSFDYALGITSKAEDMTRYQTSAMGLKLALVVRIPVSIITLAPFFGYSMQTYEITSSTGTKPNIPSVGYGSLRGGGRLTLQPIKLIGIDLWFAGQFLVSKGELGVYFPRASGSAVDGGFGINVQVIDRVQARVSGAIERYVFSMNPVVGDTNVAGGAVDIYLSGNVGVALTL
jgi:hypothetical protein